MDQQVRTGAAACGKSVYLLKPENLTRRDNDVCLPHLTTDMNKLRKTKQFKTGVQFDKSMSKDDVRRRLEMIFPALINKRYSCAARESQKSTRLEFHGERRVWDGITIKRKIKGGSALYIVVEDEDEILLQMPRPCSKGVAVSGHNNQSTPVENATFTDVSLDLQDVKPGPYVIDWKDVMDVLEEDMKNSDQMGSSRSGTTEQITSFAVIQEQHKISEAPGYVTTTSSSSTDVNWTTSLNIPSQSTSTDIDTLPDFPLVLKDLPSGQFSFDWKEDQGDAGCWNVDSTELPLLDEDLKFTEQMGSPISSNILNGAENGALQTCTANIVNQEQTEEFMVEIDDPLDTAYSDDDFPEWLSLDETSSTTQQMHTPIMTSNLFSSAKTSTIQTYTATIVNQEQPEVLTSSASTSGKSESSGISSDDKSSQPDEVIDNEDEVIETAMTINPTSGPLEGGGSFDLEFNERLPESVIEGNATFGNRKRKVPLWKSYQGCILHGRIPRGETYGTVVVTASANINGKSVKLGETDFTYVDQKKEMMKHIVSNKRRLAEFFHGVAKLLKIDDNEGIETQDSQQLGLPDRLQPEDILQPLIYAAAEIGAMEFIEIIYSLSAGRIVFQAYQNDDILPEDIAEENGHEEIAYYLRGITKRFSEEDGTGEMQTKEIDWLELAKAFEENEEKSGSVGKADEIQQEREVPFKNKSCDGEDESSSDSLSELEMTTSGNEFEEMCNEVSDATDEEQPRKMHHKNWTMSRLKQAKEEIKKLTFALDKARRRMAERDQETEELRMRPRRNSDSDSDSGGILQLRQFLTDEYKRERVQSYVDNIPEMNSKKETTEMTTETAETTDSGIQSIEPSELGSEGSSVSDGNDEERPGKMYHKDSTMSRLKRANEEIIKLTSELDEASRRMEERVRNDRYILDEARRRAAAEKDKDPHKYIFSKCFAPFFSFWDLALLLVISGTVLTVFQASRETENPVLSVVHIILRVNFGKFYCLEGAILFSIILFALARLSFFVGTLLGTKASNKSMAYALAWSYYFGYLKLVLPQIEGQIGISKKYRYKIIKKKLVILIPKTCYTYSTITKADPRIKCAGNLDGYGINVCGILEKSYNHTVYRIEMPRPDGGIDEYHVVLEYATPLMSLYEMSQYAECRLSCQERDEQVVLFLRKLREILDGDTDCKGKYELVPISGEHGQIADVLVQMLNDANLTLDEGAEAE